MTTVSEAGTFTSQTSTTAQSSAPKVGKEFESFIRLLTAQMRNQDPLAPLDSTQFVEQLATFSALEQQVRSNVNLENISKMIYDLGSLVAGQWLGQTVSIESSWIPYTGANIRFTADIPAAADRSVLTVRDSSGILLWSETLDPAATTYTWDGRTSAGGTVPADSVLQFRIDNYKGSQQIGAVAPRVITQVTSIGSENGSVYVGTSSMLSAELGAVQAVGTN